MADAASGIGAALDWDRWLFVNVDLGIHLLRPPAGEWMAMDASTTIGPTGMGLCSSTLFDRDGAVGTSTQSLLVGPR
jgi:acyl-CoA thioesterase